MPDKRRPGRPKNHEIEERLSIYTLHDPQVLHELDTYLEIDISTPTLPAQIMKLDKVDYEKLKSAEVGRFFAKRSPYHGSQPTAFVNTRKKDGEFSLSASYVHSLVCSGKGYLWHRNEDLLDNRRENFATDIMLQHSTIGAKPKPMPEVQPYDPTEPHPSIDLLTGKPAEETDNITQYMDSLGIDITRKGYE